MRQRFNVPMQASMAEFVLMNPEMSTEVIADGCHLAPELLEFAYRMKGANRLCLVTDCNRALVTSHDGGFLRRWDVETGELLLEAQAHEDAIQDMQVC